MSDQSKLGLGQIITTPQERDAIHIAVAPVIAANRTFPGEHAGLDESSEASTKLRSDKWIGVIDPFLPDGTIIQKGERVWLYLYPGSITSLRHEWTHPAFASADLVSATEASRRWIEGVAGAIGISYEDLLGYAESVATDGSYQTNNSFEVPPDFWEHYQRVTGTAVPQSHQITYFSCSC